MPSRAAVLAGSFAAGICWIGLLTLLLPDGFVADLALDRDPRWGDDIPYPFTIQNVMWIVFFVTAGELIVRHLVGADEADQLRLGLLPEDRETMLNREELKELVPRVNRTDPDEQYWMQRLLTRTMLQFLSTGSIEQVNAVFNSSMELYQHETELRYNMLRYFVWLIPTLGFIGTVVGIAFALGEAGRMFAGIDPNADVAALGQEMMTELTGALGVAFYTTMLALLQSAALMFALHVVQGREESALNRIGQYCLKNLINRLYVE